MTQTNPCLVAALYRFVPLPHFAELRRPLSESMDELGILGSLLLAEEGINGTIAGPPDHLHLFIDQLRQRDVDGKTPFAELEVKWSTHDRLPFRRAKVRLKREIVTMGIPGIDPNCVVGTYVEPEQWNDLIERQDVVVVDTRNDYEVAIGTFEGAISPQTESFREFPQFVSQHLDPSVHRNVAMFCTGGIRCEKSTAYLKQCGFENVYHLRGGILKYLEVIPEDQSRWQGECFVFDHRVSVGHGLTVGDHQLCHGCGWPITIEMTSDPGYEAGVCCPRCVGEITESQAQRRRMRQRQLDDPSSSDPPHAPSIH
ncbi:MAG: rhodanese-related sulfurtransferase [Planctomycetota bacterium]